MSLRYTAAFALCLLVTLPAHARRRVDVVRLGLAIDAPHLQTWAIEHRIVPQTIDDEHLADSQRYMAMADKLGILWPYSAQGARRVGRALHLSHVAIFEASGPKQAGSLASVLHVRLLDTRSGRMALNRRYPLPGGELDEAGAQRIVAALRFMLFGERAQSPAGHNGHDAQELSPLAQVGRHKQAQQDDEVEVDLDNDNDDNPGDEADAADVHRAKGAGHKNGAHPHTVQVGLGYAMRLAKLSAPGAPCYCTDGGFAPGIVGLRLASVIQPKRVSPFGLHLGASLGFATLPVFSQTSSDESQTLPWSVHADVALRLFDAAALRAAPFVGLGYARFPISRGPFVGTGYTTLHAGLDLSPKVPFKYLVLTFGGQFEVVAHAGLEAARLGQFRYGLGYRIFFDPTLALGPFRIGVLARFGAVTTSYAGKSALYDAAAYRDVRLDDQVLDMQVHFGAAL